MERIAEKEEGERRSRPRWRPRAPSSRREPLAAEDLGDEAAGPDAEEDEEDGDDDDADDGGSAGGGHETE